MKIAAVLLVAIAVTFGLYAGLVYLAWLTLFALDVVSAPTTAGVLGLAAVLMLAAALLRAERRAWSYPGAPN